MLPGETVKWLAAFADELHVHFNWVLWKAFPIVEMNYSVDTGIPNSINE